MTLGSLARLAGADRDDPTGCLDDGGTAPGDDDRIVGHGVGVRQVHPGQADPDEQNEQVDGLPEAVYVAAGLGGFDGGEVSVGDGQAVGRGFVERDAFQMCPGDHAVVLGVIAGQIVDVSREFGDCVGAQGDRPEEFGAVGGHHVTKEGLFVPEVSVEAFLAGLRGPGDAVDSASSQTVLGELGSCGRQDFAA